MKFFYDLFLKFKNYVVGGIVIFLLLLINDFLLVSVLSHNNKKIEYPKGEEIAFDDSYNLSTEKEITEKPKFKVDIKGEVKKPGVYEVDENMNVYDAIIVAGGLTKKAVTSNINLSKKLKDQMVIIIPDKSSLEQLKTEQKNCGQEKQETISPVKNDNIINDAIVSQAELVNSSSDNIDQDNKLNESSTTKNTNLISINNASLEELLTLPGIGESKAKSIISYRETNCFNTIDELKNISGIGDSIFEKIKDYITV